MGHIKWSDQRASQGRADSTSGDRTNTGDRRRQEANPEEIKRNIALGKKHLGQPESGLSSVLTRMETDLNSTLREAQYMRFVGNVGNDRRREVLDKLASMTTKLGEVAKFYDKARSCINSAEKSLPGLGMMSFIQEVQELSQSEATVANQRDTFVANYCRDYNQFKSPNQANEPPEANYQDKCIRDLEFSSSKLQSQSERIKGNSPNRQEHDVKILKVHQDKEGNYGLDPTIVDQYLNEINENRTKIRATEAFHQKVAKEVDQLKALYAIVRGEYKQSIREIAYRMFMVEIKKLDRDVGTPLSIRRPRGL